KIDGAHASLSELAYDAVAAKLLGQLWLLLGRRCRPWRRRLYRAHVKGVGQKCGHTAVISLGDEAPQGLGALRETPGEVRQLGGRAELLPDFELRLEQIGRDRGRRSQFGVADQIVLDGKLLAVLPLSFHVDLDEFDQGGLAQR